MVSLAFVELMHEATERVGVYGAAVALLLGALFMLGVDLHSPRLQQVLGWLTRGGRASSAPVVAALRADLATVSPSQPFILRPAVAPSGGAEPAWSASPAPVALGRPGAPASPVADPDTASSCVRTAAAQTALLATLAVALHNFPEGLVLFASALESLPLGVFLAVAFAAHSIPAGMAVAASVLHATHDRRRALGLGLAAGLVGTLAAVVAGLLLSPLLTSAVVALMLAFIAGVLVYTSLDELLPAAREHLAGHDVALSLMVGVVFMFGLLATLHG
jgi:zinc transporter ZupT